MVDSEERRTRGGETCDAIEGGYSIFLDGETIQAFMESGDFSSARELDHFKEIEAQIEKWLDEGEGVSLLALSVNESRLSRDFSVLQIAHLMAKHGKKVLIVDCDFLSPGLNGLVENTEDYGFLDILLYGSSLRSISRATGIDGVSVAGSGSFPVSRTIPFAVGEFRKIKDFLTKRNDAVIYCSTLYTDDGTVNPLCTEVKGILLCCRIEEMGEGQLQRSLADLGSKVPPVDLICFCDRKEEALVPKGAVEGAGEEATVVTEESHPPGSTETRDESIPAAGEEKAAAYIEKTDEIEKPERKVEGRFNIPRIVTIAIAVIIVGFIVWWVIIDRSIMDKQVASQRKELVQKQRDVRERAETAPAEREEVRSLAGADTAVTDGGTLVATQVDEQHAPGEVKTEESRLGAEEAAANQPTAADTGLVSGARYAVHIASFRDINRAGREKEFLEKKGFSVSIVVVEIKGDEWFRILVGGYETKERAVRARAELMDLTGVGYARIIELTEEK
jgi:cytoskeletal protein RodZ